MFERGSIAASLVQTIVDVAVEKGADLNALLSVLGWSGFGGSDHRQRVDLETVVKLYQMAIFQTGDPTLGLCVGEEVRPGSLNTLGYALMSSKNVLEAYRLQKSFGSIISDAAELNLHITDRTATAVFTVDYPDERSIRPINDMFHSTIWNYCQWITRDGGMLDSVTFTHEAPSYRDKYRSVFRVEPQFGAKECSLVFDIKYLDSPMHHADEDLNSLMKDRMEAQHQDIRTNATLYASVCHQIRKLMPDKKATLTQVAERMNMSDRSLSRRLKEEGYLFKNLLLNVREAMAIEQLRDQNISVTDIADRLGYRDYSAFSHAFRTWTGISPSEYRDRILG